ncbi:MAG TPA: STAS domain-containing protein [Acidimicrobiia bacterium]
MTENRFDVTTRVEDGRLLVTMTGDVNAGAASKMEEVQNAVADTGLRGVVLDFGKVDYINSTGIALIVSLLARARAANVEVVAFGLTDHYRQIFQITRLSDFVGIYPDKASALRAAPV